MRRHLRPVDPSIVRELWPDDIFSFQHPPQDDELMRVFEVT
jgi:hypothetical protein